jgi:lipopolysaccharide transport system permease protein
LVASILLTAGLGVFNGRVDGIFAGYSSDIRSGFVNLWFYITPIVYPASVIPEEFRYWVFWLNPLAAIAEVYRDLVLVGQVTHWGEWGVASIISVAVFWIGVGFYRRLRPAFADVL